MTFERITVGPGVMAGVPCIRGTRITVADGMSTEQILSFYPQLSEADVPEALRFAAVQVAEREIELPRGA